jgi:hypothetical protein
MESRGDQTRADAWRNMAADWAPRPTHRYAIFLFGRRVTPWRESYKAALADALANGHASQEPGDAPYLWVGADVVSERL